jgi:hypothetical protein
MKRPIPAGQLSLDDYLARHKWCNRHRRLDCRCGHKPKAGYRAAIDSKILDVMRLRANGRVAVSSEWISIQLLIEHEIDITSRAIRDHLKAMATRGFVIKEGYCGGYKLAPNLDSFRVDLHSHVAL